MDYQEAIEALSLGGLNLGGPYGRMAEFCEGLSTAVSAMEELQEYHKSGMTPREVIKMQYGYAVKMTDLEDYQRIGTLDEVQAAMEKQKAKKPVLIMNEVSGMFIDYADGHGGYRTQMNNWWHCPCCNGIVGQRVIVHKHHHDQRKKKYCEKCGQHIDWRDTYETD